MKKLVLLLLLLALPAYAADVAQPKLKLVSSSPCSLSSCTGFYAGFNVAGIATNANILAQGINGSIAAGGQNIGGQAGYQFWNGTWFFGPEVFAEYTYGGSAIVAPYSAPKYLFGQIVKLGAPMSTFFGGITPANPTGLPSILTSETISPYLFMGAAERSWGTGVASGGGITFLIPTSTGSATGKWFVDARYMNIQYTGSKQASPVETVPQENIVWVGLNYKY